MTGSGRVAPLTEAFRCDDQNIGEPLLLSKPLGSNQSSRESGCYWLPCVVVGDGAGGHFYRFSLKLEKRKASYGCRTAHAFW